MLKESLTSMMEEPMAESRTNSTQLNILDSYPSITSTDIDNIPYEILESIFHDAKKTVLHFSLSKEYKNLIHSKC